MAIVILGAGLTGLSTAYHLEHQGIYTYKLFEKDGAVGGLCRSISQDGFTFDMTGHVLHISDSYFKEFIESTIGFAQLNAIARKSAIYSHGIFTSYPFQRNLYGLPIATIAECIEGFIKRPRNNKPQSFHDWILTHFGKGFANHFFFPFQKKNFAYDLKKITAEWTQRFIPATTLEDILAGALTDQSSESVGYNAQLYYPRTGGIQAFIDALENKLKNPVYTTMQANKINLAQKYVEFSNGHVEFYDTLISTMPLNELLACIEDSPTTHLQRAAPKLLCNSVLNINIGTTKPHLTNAHWIYYPEKQYPFYRIGFPSNLSENATPPSMSSLAIECAFLNKNKRWQSATTNTTVLHAKNLFALSCDELVTQATIPIKHAYVLYDHWRSKNLPPLLTRLASHSIHSIGRYGSWKYGSMQEAVLEGKQCAEYIGQQEVSRVEQFHGKKTRHNETSTIL